MTELRVLDIFGASGLGDEALEHLARLSNLTRLSVVGPNIS
jgi:hypothetical protein